MLGMCSAGRGSDGAGARRKVLHTQEERLNARALIESLSTLSSSLTDDVDRGGIVVRILDVFPL